jgi:oxazoline/thiazoline synthase
VSPLTGVVTRLERMDADLALNASYVASHNFSPWPDSVDELRAGLSGDSYGKGSTAEQAEASALMEAIERYSGVFQGDEIRVTRQFTDFPPGQAIVPNDVMLFSDAQYRHDQAAMAAEEDASPPPAPFDPSALIEWSPAWSLRDGCFRYLPTSLLYYFHNGAGADQTSADSNGCAAGNTLEEAIVQGFLELVERDSYAIWWYNRVRRPELDLDQIDDSYIRDLRTQLKDAGRQLWVLDITSDLGIPSYVAISHWKEDSQEYLEFGSGAHFDPRIAALRAITELNQFFSIGLMTRRNAQGSGSHSPSPWRLDEHPYFLPGDNRAVPPATRADFGHLDHRTQVVACVELVKQEGLDFVVLDQTRPDIGVPVVRVIVPGMRHFYRRFAPGRLYDVPVKVGLRDSPIPESALNPYLPPT